MAVATLIDGRPCGDEWLDERGFQFGDGLFETIAVVDGAPCLWEAHLARLQLGCERLQLPPPQPDLLTAEARDLCAGRSRAVLKLYWTAGRSARGYRRPVPLQPMRVLRCSDWPYVEPPHSWSLRLCLHRLGDNPRLAGIKHLNRLDQVLARAEWDDPAIDEGLVLDQRGSVVCGTMSNLFVESGDGLITPPIDRAGIGGVVRALVLRQAERLGVPVTEAPIEPEALYAADALYLCNSLIGVVRAAHLGHRAYDLTRPEHPAMSAARRLCHLPDPGRDTDG